MRRSITKFSRQAFISSRASYFCSPCDTWATIDPFTISGANPGKVQNLSQGKWFDAETSTDILDPLNGDVILRVPDTQVSETGPFIDALRSVPKSGVHNPVKNPSRYTLYGEVMRNLAEVLKSREGEEFFTKLIQRVAPKSDGQARGEVRITANFLANWAGDQPRFLAQGFIVSGDHYGQSSQGLRWPFGPVGIIAPFNFPIEIPTLQLMGSLMMGNRPLLKVDSKVSVVMEQFLRLAHHCGMPKEDVEFLNGGGPVTESLVRANVFRSIQFTGSSKIAEHLSEITRGKVRIEDAGFDWKILGPDIHRVDYVAYVCDQDAYAFGGQKCSSQSIMFAHENWVKEGIFEKMGKLASRRNLDDLTIVPVLSWDNKKIQAHVDSLLEIPGSRILFGGKPLKNHSIPEIYGSYEPTAVFVPLEEMMKEENYGKCMTELFGPFQVCTEYKSNQIDTVLEALERMDHHLTAAVVSNDENFVANILANSVNGTTYTGLRARTTGAPQNHWFGPAGDPRGAGIGSPEAIKLIWSCHREIVRDFADISDDWVTPEAT